MGVSINKCFIRGFIDFVDRLHIWKAPIDHALGLRPNAPTDSFFFHTNRHSLIHSAH
jgi:hypothetical protein